MDASTPPGILIIGASGSGKSTLVNILARNSAQCPVENAYIPAPLQHALFSLDPAPHPLVVVPRVHASVFRFLGNSEHFYVRTLECPAIGLVKDLDAACLELWFNTWEMLKRQITQVVLIVEYHDRLSQSLVQNLQTMAPFLQKVVSDTGKDAFPVFPITVVITKVSSVPQMNFCNAVVIPTLRMLFLRTLQLPTVAQRAYMFPFGLEAMQLSGTYAPMFTSLRDLGSRVKLALAPSLLHSIKCMELPALPQVAPRPITGIPDDTEARQYVASSLDTANVWLLEKSTQETPLESRQDVVQLTTRLCMARRDLTTGSMTLVQVTQSTQAQNSVFSTQGVVEILPTASAQ